MEIREIFLRCADTGGGRPVELTLVLRNGREFRGHALGIESGTWALRLAGRDEDCLYLPEGEVSGVIVHVAVSQPVLKPAPQSVPQPAPEWPPSAAGGRPVHVEWQGETPTTEEVVSASATLESILEALASLPGEQTGAIASIHLLSAQAGRFRVVNGALEAGFVEGVAPPSSRELMSLLALIL
jgi:hypothetical protein